jgi:hypothetical protein
MILNIFFSTKLIRQCREAKKISRGTNYWKHYWKILFFKIQSCGSALGEKYVWCSLDSKFGPVEESTIHPYKDSYLNLSPLLWKSSISSDFKIQWCMYPIEPFWVWCSLELPPSDNAIDSARTHRNQNWGNVYSWAAVTYDDLWVLLIVSSHGVQALSVLLAQPIFTWARSTGVSTLWNLKHALQST